MYNYFITYSLALRQSKHSENSWCSSDNGQFYHPIEGARQGECHLFFPVIHSYVKYINFSFINEFVNCDNL